MHTHTNIVATHSHAARRKYRKTSANDNHLSMDKCVLASKRPSIRKCRGLVWYGMVWCVLEMKEMLPFPFVPHAMSASQKRILFVVTRRAKHSKTMLHNLSVTCSSQERNNENDCMLHAITNFIGVVLVRKGKKSAQTITIATVRCSHNTNKST